MLDDCDNMQHRAFTTNSQKKNYLSKQGKPITNRKITL